LQLSAQTDPMKMFIFGHSLLDHRPPINPTPSNETTVPHWLFLLAQEAGYDYAAGGQYGFLPQHANVPPIAQWGYDLVPGVWESDTEPFSAADITTVLLTAGNFVQYQPPTEEYFSDPGITPINATETVFDWVDQQESGVRFYIYENWPDMAAFLNNGFPASTAEFANYNNFTLGEFHDWWIEYHDALLQSRANLEVKMIPVGPILSKIHTDLLAGQIPVSELYEDDAPHGRATTYFLASLITYMAVYEKQAPTNFTVPNIVHQTVRDNYANLVTFIWNELNAFNTTNGDSRVFFEMTTALPIDFLHPLQAKVIGDDIRLTWQLSKYQNAAQTILEYRTEGQPFSTLTETATLPQDGRGTFYFNHRQPSSGLHYYRLKQIKENGDIQFSQIASVQLPVSMHTIYPNPSQGSLVIETQQIEQVHIYDAQGILRLQTKLRAGENRLDISAFSAGIYWLKTETSGSKRFIKY
ncbi:MAG: T9SS type A sorting domain-containing protein, partial [Saprospiraceae bacterium]